MAVTEAFWHDGVLPDEVAGYDIHVVAGGGTSQRLDRLMALNYDIPDPNDPTKTISEQKSPFFARQDGIKTVYEAQCVLDPPAAGSTKRKIPSLGNATFDTDSGEVVYPTAVNGANILRNFIVLVRITDQNGVAFTPPPSIRIHLHPGVRKISPTPSPLTIHHDTHPDPTPLTRPRFRLLAEFSDDTMGDVSHMPAFQYQSREPAKVVASPQGKLKALVPDAVGVAIQITAPPSLLNTAVPDGLVNTKPPWNTPVEAHLIGKKSGGAARRANRFNFLFLPEGFVDGESPVFEQIVQDLAEFIHRTRRTYPYNLLKDRINFWWAFVPSPKPGTTVSYQNVEHHDASGSVWFDLSAVPSTAIKLTVPIDVLVREAGLPALADQTVLSTPDQITAWNKLFGAFSPHLAAADDLTVAYWRLLANRFYIDDIDTAFGLAFGERERLESRSASRAPTLSPIRCGRKDLDEFLGALTDGPPGHAGVTTIGDTWAKKDAPDRPFVVFLCAGSREGGAREGKPTDTLAIGLPDRSRIDATIAPARRRATLNPEAPVGKASIDNEVTVAHELAHALGIPGKLDVGLNDEYGEFPAASSPTTEQATSIRTYPNAQLRDDVLLGGVLKGDRIKWAKWHRIEKAAVLDLPPVSLDPAPVKVGSRFRLVLKAAPPRRFSQDEKVRLRNRPLSTAPDPSPELQVTKIESKTSIVVSVLTLPTNMGSFSIGDIVFKPRRGLVGGASAELKMVSQAIQDHVTATNRPLNAKKPPAAYACSAAGTAPLDPHNRPKDGPTFKMPRYSRWLVGLYDGGARFECNVFHSSGACIMRREQREQPPSPASIYAFCPVCRYALVDNLEPTLHGTVDDLYQGFWPEP